MDWTAAWLARAAPTVGRRCSRDSFFGRGHEGVQQDLRRHARRALRGVLPSPWAAARRRSAWGELELGVVALVLLVRPRVAAQRCATYVGSLWYALRSTASFSGAEATHNYRESMGGLPKKGQREKITWPAD